MHYTFFGLMFAWNELVAMLIYSLVEAIHKLTQVKQAGSGANQVEPS